MPLRTALPVALAQFLRPAEETASRAKALPLRIPALDSVLPDRGLPRGAVIELASPLGLGGATRVALAACVSAQREAVEQSFGRVEQDGWCVWVDPRRTLYAPAVMSAGVNLDRLLVLQPTANKLARLAVRVTTSLVFRVIVVDVVGIPGSLLRADLGRYPNIVRRLAMAAEGSSTTVLLLTDARARRPLPLPVAMRIELERPSQEELRVHIAKERYGRISNPISILDCAHRRSESKPAQIAASG